MIILSKDDAKKTIALSTKALEPSLGDMLRDPQLVFSKVEEMAAAFRLGNITAIRNQSREHLLQGLEVCATLAKYINTSFDDDLFCA